MSKCSRYHRLVLSECVCTLGAMPLLPVPVSVWALGGRGRCFGLQFCVTVTQVLLLEPWLEVPENPGDVRVRWMLVPWVGLFVERSVGCGCGSQTALLGWEAAAREGVQRLQVSCGPPALKSFVSFSPVPTVSFSELRSLLASGSARLFDVRSPEEAAAGTIPGALNIPGIRFPLLAEEQSAHDGLK